MQHAALQGYRLSQALTPKKALVFVELSKYEGDTMTSASRALSFELGVDQSTARRALQFFRKRRLVRCGDVSDKWTPLELTPSGRFMLTALKARLPRETVAGEGVTP